jgi:tetratricopeptide (TPR) repeat protein
MRMDPAAAQAVLRQFVALGYVEPPTEDQSKAAANAVREAKFNLARDYLDARRPQDALPLLEMLAHDQPAEARFRLHLAQCYLGLRRRDAAREILQRLLSEPPPESAQEAAVVVGEPSKQGQPKSRPWADLLMGVIHYEEGNMQEALACLLRAEQADPGLPNLHLRIGETYLRQLQVAEAERAFQKALEIDGDNAEAHLGLAMVRLRQRNYAEAAEQALLAVSLQHFLPLGHFYLGVALARMGQRARAILAFETCLAMLPGLIAAHRWLAAMHSQPGGDLEKAIRHRALYMQLRGRRQARAG